VQVPIVKLSPAGQPAGLGAKTAKAASNAALTEIAKAADPSSAPNKLSNHADSSSSRAQAKTAISAPAGLDPTEIKFPKQPFLNMSFDALNWEIGEVERQQRQARDEDTRQELAMHLMNLNNRVTVITAMVDDGKLSLENYLKGLEQRIQKDKQLFTYYKTVCEKASTPENENDKEERDEMKGYMSYLTNRVRIMKAELENARTQSAQDGEQAEAKVEG
jgi:hypothetical protein